MHILNDGAVHWLGFPDCSVVINNPDCSVVINSMTTAEVGSHVPAGQMT